jgi:hypothetical protein
MNAVLEKIRQTKMEISNKCNNMKISQFKNVKKVQKEFAPVNLALTELK